MNLNRPGTQQPYYRVRWVHTGLYAVAHLVPGTDTWSIDCEFASLTAAEKECNWMNREREQRLKKERRESELLSQRWGRLA